MSSSRTVKQFPSFFHSVPFLIAARSQRVLKFYFSAKSLLEIKMSGVLPQVVAALSSKHDIVVQYAVWALNNLALQGFLSLSRLFRFLLAVSQFYYLRELT